MVNSFFQQEAYENQNDSDKVWRKKMSLTISMVDSRRLMVLLSEHHYQKTVGVIFHALVSGGGEQWAIVLKTQMSRYFLSQLICSALIQIDNPKEI